ncbi:hypothetical protein EV122DRAFT_280012 [Schizophyllum commune]
MTSIVILSALAPRRGRHGFRHALPRPSLQEHLSDALVSRWILLSILPLPYPIQQICPIVGASLRVCAQLEKRPHILFAAAVAGVVQWRPALDVARFHVRTSLMQQAHDRGRISSDGVKPVDSRKMQSSPSSVTVGMDINPGLVEKEFYDVFAIEVNSEMQWRPSRRMFPSRLSIDICPLGKEISDETAMAMANRIMHGGLTVKVFGIDFGARLVEKNLRNAFVTIFGSEMQRRATPPQLVSYGDRPIRDKRLGKLAVILPSCVMESS